MTGERPRDEEVDGVDDAVEPADDSLREGPNDSPDVVGDEPGATLTPDRDTTATEADLETREPAQPPTAAAPFPETRASQRTLGPRRAAVVTEEKARAVAADEEHAYVDDRVSKVWVALIAGVFMAILAWGVLGGQAGLLNPRPAPDPSASPAASASVPPTVRPSPTTRPSVTPATSATPGGSATPAASPTSAAPTGSAPATTTPLPGPT
jgi:hypothetical protein